jgi:guanine nucleotide-binding protein G(i) subunit alpha
MGELLCRCGRFAFLCSSERVRPFLLELIPFRYDQALFEDATKNRMHESLTLFEQICNSHWFKDSVVILVLTKDDLFRQKIASIDLNCCFEEYKGAAALRRLIS